MTRGPGVLDALSLLSEVADELVVRSVRDTHLAWTDRAGGGAVHRGIATAVYGGLGAGLRATSRGLDRLAATGVGPRLEDRSQGRFVNAAVNGLIGDRLVRERPRLAIAMAVRNAGRDVVPDARGLAAAFPEPTGRLVVFLHGLCENESYWNRHRDRTGTTYGEALAARGWTPVFLRANTGLGLRENGVALASLMQQVVDAWPVPVTRIALVGHSLGGLVMRAAGAVAAEPVDHDWNASGHRRDHPRHSAPRRPDRLGDRARQPRARPAPGDGRLRPDPRLALGRGPRPGGRARRGRATAPARALPPGRRHADRVAAAPGRARRRRPAGAATVGVRPRPSRPRAVPRGRRSACRPHGPLRAAQPPETCSTPWNDGWHDRVFWPQQGRPRAPRRSRRGRPGRPRSGSC